MSSITYTITERSDDWIKLTAEPWPYVHVDGQIWFGDTGGSHFRIVADQRWTVTKETKSIGDGFRWVDAVIRLAFSPHPLPIDSIIKQLDDEIRQLEQEQS